MKPSACVREVEGKNMIVSWIVGSIVVNGWCQYKHEKGNEKGKVNGCEAFDALAILGNIVLDVVHVVHR